MDKFILFIVITLFFLCCSSPKEATMPFRNMGYSVERLFPIQHSTGEKMFRVWFNNGTSIDRIITVSSDSIFNNQSYRIFFQILDQFGSHVQRFGKTFDYIVVEDLSLFVGGNQCLAKPHLRGESLLLYAQCMAETLDGVPVMGVF